MTHSFGMCEIKKVAKASVDERQKERYQLKQAL
jgi:hypothetical protein